jgi:hypothetical protein
VISLSSPHQQRKSKNNLCPAALASAVREISRKPQAWADRLIRGSDNLVGFCDVGSNALREGGVELGGVFRD